MYVNLILPIYPSSQGFPYSSLSMIISRSIHVAINGLILFFFMAECFHVFLTGLWNIQLLPFFLLLRYPDVISGCCRKDNPHPPLQTSFHWVYVDLQQSIPSTKCLTFLSFSFSFFFFFFRAAPAAYGNFQARGQIGATAANLHHSSGQPQILNPLSETRD